MRPRPTDDEAINIVATHYCGMGGDYTADVVHEVAAHALHKRNQQLHGEIAELRRIMRIGDRPPGTPDAVVPRLVQYLYERKTLGERRYGTQLMTFNGRKALEDALAEITDFNLYFTQFVMEVLGDLPPGDLDG